MNGQNKKMELLGTAPVSKALLALGLPTMIGMMINALYNLVDAYFVGGLGTNQMGAITVAFPLGQVIVGLGLLFGNGAAISSIAISKVIVCLSLQPDFLRNSSQQEESAGQFSRLAGRVINIYKPPYKKSIP